MIAAIYCPWAFQFLSFGDFDLISESSGKFISWMLVFVAKKRVWVFGLRWYMYSGRMGTYSFLTFWLCLR